MSLETYESFWSAIGYSDDRRRRRMAQIRDKAGIDSGFGSAGDPIGAQTPMVQDSMLQQLARRASGENGRIDDWENLIDPTVSYGSNLRKILQKGGKAIDSRIEEDRKNWIESASDRQQRHAKEKIRDNIEAIENGSAERLRDDIAAEFGETFLTGAIAEVKALEEPTGDIGAPEPATVDEPEPVETPTVDETPAEPEPIETPTVDETPEIPAAADPVDEPAPVVDEANYSGIVGTVQLFADFIAESFKAGKRDAQTVETRNQQTLEAY